MLSICIPVFNKNIKDLHDTLETQVQKIIEDVEIVIIDDCSLEIYKNANKKSCFNSTYIELNENIGRARIRNLFLNYSKFEYLLFLDCDSKITDGNFIKNYIYVLQQNKIDVIFGGSVYPVEKPNRNHLLRWEYGSKIENIPYNIRKLEGNKRFLTNNFLIRRDIIQVVRFNENLIKYGHEDTLFNYELNKKGVEITQLDNSVLNNELEKNFIFLEKVNDSIDNLHYILKIVDDKKEFIKKVKILKIYNMYKDKRILGIYLFIFKIIYPLVKKMLISGYYFNINVFNIYRLGLLIIKFKQHPIHIHKN